VKRSLPIFGLCFVVLTLLASFIWKGALWGVSSWGFLSPFVALGVAILLVPQFFLGTPADRLGRVPRVHSKALELLVGAAVAVAVLWLLRARHELWGERASLAAAIEKGQYRWSAPLSSFVEWALYRFTNDVFLWSPRTVLTVMSIAVGTLYALAATRAAGRITGNRAGSGVTALSTAFLLSNGFIVLFFGGGGVIPITALFVFLFVMAEIQFLEGERSLALPTLLLVVAILSHVSALFLVPGYIYTAAIGVRSPASRRMSVASLASLCAAVVLLELGVSFAAGKPGPLRQLLSATAAALGSLHITPQRFWALIRDGLNEFLLIGPASVLALVLLVARGSSFMGTAASANRSGSGGSGNRRTAAIFLSVTTVASLLAIAAAAGRVDSGVRWHAAAATGPALSICALWMVSASLEDRETLRKAVLVCAALGLFHTIPWIVVNAMPSAAQRRTLALPLHPGRNEMIIAEAARARNDLTNARAWYLASLEKDPASIRANLAAGAIEMTQEEYPAAITHFSNAHDLAPSDPHYEFLLAEALIAQRWFPEAIRRLEELTTRYPDSVSFWRKLGFARNNSGKYEGAVAAYERALDLEPRNDENLRNLVSALLNRGAELQTAGNYAEAEALYSRVIAILPDDWHAYNNLAVIEMKRERWKQAREILANALKLHPYESSLHFNMGIVLEKLGRDKEALDQMLMARDLDPMYSKAPPHIERLQKKLGIWKPVGADSSAGP
jgi:tetratricopeptide (TPR) repeat protein